MPSIILFNISELDELKNRLFRLICTFFWNLIFKFIFSSKIKKVFFKIKKI